jgi:type IV secretory pathway VirB10-like protein
MSDGFPDRLRHDPPPPSRPPRDIRRPAKGVIVVGVAAACLLGLVGGYAMKPVLNEESRSKPHRTVPLPQEPQGLGIQVLPGPVPQPQDNAAETEAPPPDLPDPAPASEEEARNAPPAPMVVAQPPQQTAPPPERVVVRPSFNCRYARSQAERMVCADPQLAAADRRLSQAYRDALNAGVPRQILDRQQAAWMAAREDAARYGPAAVADVYGQRTAELQGLARY